MKTILEVPESFYREEERYDYMISEKMKKVWAVQLDLLSELKRVCEKYGLQYYAEYGTLIGAIRHKGFIPWDDDMDIAMKREDYDKLLKIGATEFKEPYFLQSSHSEIFPRGYSRLRNSNTTAISRHDFGKNLNCGIFVDIFPLDNLPDNILVRKIWQMHIRCLHSSAVAGCEKNKDGYRGFVRTLLYYIGKTLTRVYGYDNIMKRLDKICAKYNGVDVQKISDVAFAFGKKSHIWDKSCFDTSHLVPFEFTDINVPDGYDSHLRILYNDYMKPVHKTTKHGGMILEPEIPYIQYLKEHSKEEIRRMLENLNKKCP